MTTVIASAVLSHNRHKHAATAQSILLSQELEISPATMENMEEDGEGSVGRTFGDRKAQYSSLTVWLELELSLVREESASPSTATNEYMMKVNNWERKMVEEELNRMTLLREMT